MKINIVGPYVMKHVRDYNYYKDAFLADKEENPGAYFLMQATAQHLMSRQEYRMCLEVNYPDLYKEFKETDFSYMNRLR